MKTLILILTLLLSLSCSHKKLIKDAHVKGNCSERIKDIQPPTGQSIIDLSKQATSGTASIAIAGVGAATDGLVIALTNPITKITLCLATFTFIAAYSHGNPTDFEVCSYFTGPPHNPKLTQKALNETKSWRCPNLDYISEGLRDVARCYVDRNEKDKARLQLESILSNKTISPCLSESERSKVKDQILSL